MVLFCSTIEWPIVTAKGCSSEKDWELSFGTEGVHYEGNITKEMDLCDCNADSLQYQWWVLVWWSYCHLVYSSWVVSGGLAVSVNWKCSVIIIRSTVSCCTYGQPSCEMAIGEKVLSAMNEEIVWLDGVRDILMWKQYGPLAHIFARGKLVFGLHARSGSWNILLEMQHAMSPD